MDIIYANFAQCEHYTEGSFVEQWHEYGRWDDNAYLALENALYLVNEELKDPSAIPREILWPIARIFSHLMMTCGAALDKNDAFFTSNINRQQLYDRRERMQIVFEGFFKGEMPDIRALPELSRQHS